MFNRKHLALIAFAAAFALTGCMGNGYNGDIEHDALIMRDKILESNGDNIENVMHEYAVDEGYGMGKAKEVLMKATQML